MKPVLLMIAGSNGSGKTTVTISLRRNHWSEDVEYINPDDIAKEKFGDWNSRDAILDAANWAQARREELNYSSNMRESLLKPSSPHLMKLNS